VPNFLEAQTRAKVSRAKSDLRSLATAITAYMVDWNRPPLSSGHPATVSTYRPHKAMVASVKYSCDSIRPNQINASGLHT
jgi:hypothetical protein